MACDPYGKHTTNPIYRTRYCGGRSRNLLASSTTSVCARRSADVRTSLRAIGVNIHDTFVIASVRIATIEVINMTAGYRSSPSPEDYQTCLCSSASIAPSTRKEDLGPFHPDSARRDASISLLLYHHRESLCPWVRCDLLCESRSSYFQSISLRYQVTSNSLVQAAKKGIILSIQ
jgi:hypothetical protein